MKKIIGGTFLISGTAIGGGIVLLPAIIGMYGYLSAIVLLILLWLMNVLIAFIFLEANYYMPVGSSMISLTKFFFGENKQWITWILCLFFLYTLLCAYLSGISEIFNAYFHIPKPYVAIGLVAAMGLILFLGLKYLSGINDLIVITMFVLLCVLFLFLSKKADGMTIMSHPTHFPIMAVPIVFTAFGFTVIVPSLRIYFDNNIKNLKKSFIIGTTIPFLIYVVWTTIVMGLVPNTGLNSFETILNHHEPVNAFKSTLIQMTHNQAISWIIEAFIFTAFATSFIGIALATYHFLCDGLKIRQTVSGKLKIILLVFIPPLVVTLLQSNLLLTALGFAGLLSTIVFGVFPILFVLIARYKFKLKTVYKTPFSKFIIALLSLGCLVIIGVETYTIIQKML